MIWLCITSVLSITLVISNQCINASRITVFPAASQSIAGVFQVSFLNNLNQPEYAFNVSEARRLCLSLGVNIASKAQVQEALTRGLETCRYGWIDEHLAVIPRRKALSNCGRNQAGLVTWRASVTKKFDVFCFNESDAATQLKDTTESPLSRRVNLGQTQSISRAADSTLNMHSTSFSSLLPSSSSTPKTIDSKAGPAQFLSSAQGPTGAKVILITSMCALFLVAIIILAYIKMRRSHVLSSEVKQQLEHIQTEEWTCEKNTKESKEDVEEDERIEVGDNAN